MKNQQDDYRIKALEYCAQRMLHSQLYDVEKNELTPNFLSLHKAVNYALNNFINLGGGFSFDDIGDYWFCEYRPGIRIQLYRKHGTVTEPIPRYQFLAIARIIWDKEKHGQLTLFEYEK